MDFPLELTPLVKASAIPSPANSPAEENQQAEPDSGFQLQSTPPADDNQEGPNTTAGNWESNFVPDIGWDESDNEAAVEEDTTIGGSILSAEVELARSEMTSDLGNTCEVGEAPTTEQAANCDPIADDALEESGVHQLEAAVEVSQEEVVTTDQFDLTVQERGLESHNPHI
ncbi:hypothetical protein R1sor_014045 [Riccia sorocarpa]|uniref:Clathrin light chain n=1 Tax=Riccia sorocarpa TaxID=122646 RepID=A0ABD3HA75_9MARC